MDSIAMPERRSVTASHMVVYIDDRGADTTGQAIPLQSLLNDPEPRRHPLLEAVEGPLHQSATRREQQPELTAADPCGFEVGLAP